MKLNYKKTIVCIFMFIFLSPVLFTYLIDNSKSLITEKDDLKSSAYQLITFNLFAENGIILDTSDLWLYWGWKGNGKEFGVPVYVDISYDEVWIYDMNLKTYIYYEDNVDLSGLLEYNITCEVGRLTVNLNAREIGEFTLTKLSGLLPHSTISFGMLPYTSREFILEYGSYYATWLNKEDGSEHLYDFTMTSNNIEITLDSIYYDIDFTLSDQFLDELDVSYYLLYIDGIKSEFGIVELNKSSVLIQVYDRFGIVGFNQIISLEGLSEYNIVVPVYKLKIENLASEVGNIILKEEITQETYEFSLEPDSNRVFRLTGGSYIVTWLKGENHPTYEYNINLISDYILTLIYYTVYFSIFNFDGIGLDNNLVRFYLNGERCDFGSVGLNNKYNDLLVLDFFDNVIYNETIDLFDKTEWNIYVEMYNIEIRNAYSYAIDLVFERNGFTVEITIPAQFSIEYRFILDVDYNITWYKSSDGSYIGNKEITFTKNNLIVSFGLVTNLLSEPNNILILIISIISIVSIIGVLLRYRKQLILCVRKRFKTTGDTNEQ